MVQNSTSRNPREASWGAAAGLLTACGVTLTGVFLDLQQMTIITRALISGCAAACIATLFAWGWQLVTPQQEED
ncbi:hypothetical protein SH661x_000550 [Planctomicrobium sp. SH661]|uniref:hypothetical protein n=1 Tax=Planctomicrobium sp. SH661 TaxID=3448124 RepID=UPI003F5BE72E